jgi:glutathione S-transferase
VLGDNAWFAGDRLTLADLMIAPQIDFFVQMPEWAPLTATTPNLIAWLARMNDRACMKQTTWERVAQMAAGAAQAA